MATVSDIMAIWDTILRESYIADLEREMNRHSEMGKFFKGKQWVTFEPLDPDLVLPEGI